VAASLAQLTLILSLAAAQPFERLTAIQVQGNTVTPEPEILQLAELEVGMVLEPTTLDAAAERLRRSKKFDRVEVLKRFASIADPSQVLCVIVVDEGPVTVLWDQARVEPDGTVVFAPVRKLRGARFMFVPVLDFEDGYGFSYGLRSAIPNPLGERSFLSFPATWGGEKRAGVELEKEMRTPAFNRVSAGAAITRREHPLFEQNDDRQAVWIRAERDILRSLRAGVGAGWDRVSFLGERDRFVRAGVDVVLDTRLDPMLARNAVYARASWDRLAFDRSGGAHRTDLEMRGYVGLPGQAVVVLRALRQDSNRPLPPYLSPMLGGIANLRGVAAGSAVGDTLVAGSMELRLPLTSPLSIGKLGISAFVDTAAVYEKGQKLRDQPLDRAAGGGVWFSAAFLRVNVYVARAAGHSTRAHFGTSVLF
jgi:outer membrane protein assembly factor BamA